MRSGLLWGKKDDRCDPDDPGDQEFGSVWDHVAFDPQTKLAISVVAGKRGVASVRRAVREFAARTDKRVPQLVTTDGYKPYRDVLLEVYGKPVEAPRRSGPGRPPKPRLQQPAELVYVAVQKHRRKGRVVKITLRQVFGTAEQAERALAQSSVSHQFNTALVERYNATDRHLCARKGRKVYRFSKDPGLHRAATAYSQGIYNFCRANRGLTRRTGSGSDRRLIHRSPAMAQGITDHVWSVLEFVYHQACPPVTL